MATTTHLVTADELMQLSGNGRYELVKGVLLTMSPSSAEHGVISANIAYLLISFVRGKDLGMVYGAETGFHLERDPDTVLAPDAAFISRERVATRSPGYADGPPDLAVEVLSPGDRKSKIEGKTAQWLSFGVRAVWLIDPKSRTVEMILASGMRKLFNDTDELVDDDVLPDFRVAVSEIFLGL